MKKKSWIILILSVAVLLIAGASAWIYSRKNSSQQQVNQKPIETLKVGSVSEFSMLILAAERQGFFERNGLDVQITKYPTGVAAFQGLKNKQVDISAAADFVGVRNSFDNQDYKIIASIMDTPELFRIVGRKDKGIQNPSDLKGKKIGLTKNTAGEFFLSTFLTFNNLSPSDISVFDGEPPALTEALKKGNVDAVISARFHTYQLSQELDGNATIFPAQSNTLAYQLLFAHQSLGEQRPLVIQHFIQALVEAEDYLKSSPGQLKTVLADELKRPDDYINEATKQFNFRVSLDQSMLLTMEDAARWNIQNKLTGKTKVPNYLDYIHFDGLEKVKPGAITITH